MAIFHFGRSVTVPRETTCQVHTFFCGVEAWHAEGPNRVNNALIAFQV